MNLQKELQNRIGELIGKDYFKLEDGVKVQMERYSSWTNEGSDTEYSNEPDIFETGIFLNGEVLGNRNGDLCCMDLEEKDFKNGVYQYGVDENGDISVEEYEKVEIIGQEPSLNDVLMAIDFNSIDKIRISSNAMRIKKGIIDILYWLDKSLFQQSEETLQAIYNLLKSDEK